MCACRSSPSAEHPVAERTVSLPAGCANAFSWQPCQGTPLSPYADIKEVSLTPEDPAAGDTVHFAIDGTAKINVSAGSLEIGVVYSGLPIYSETRDLCDMASCPIKKGDLKIAYDQYLPPIVPPVGSAPLPPISQERARPP